MNTNTQIKGFEKYLVSRNGTVINSETGHTVTKRLIREYHYVDLRNNGIRKNARLGRLVASHFIDNPLNKPQVNHIDGNRLNDNADNLEWVTVSENQIHKNKLMRKNGSYVSLKGRLSIRRKKIDKIFVLRNKGLKHREIAKSLKIGVSTVTHVLLGSRRSNQ